MKSKWETAHRNPFGDLMKWHDSILESQKRKEKNHEICEERIWKIRSV